MSKQTEERIKDILSQSFGVGRKQLVSGASFEIDLNVAQTDLQGVVDRIFEELQVKIDSGTKRQFKTVGELVEFIKDCLDEIEE